MILTTIWALAGGGALHLMRSLCHLDWMFCRDTGVVSGFPPHHFWGQALSGGEAAITAGGRRVASVWAQYRRLPGVEVRWMAG